MRKLLLAATAACALCTAPGGRAQVGLCTTADGPCSSLADQLLQYTEQGLQLNQETITAVQEYTSALPLTTLTFQDLTDEINQILGLVSTASMLTGNTNLILNNLSTLAGYPLGNIPNWHQQLTNESNAIGAAFRVCGQVITLEQSLGREAQLVTQFVDQVMALIGRQQSLQELNHEISQLTQGIQKMEAATNGCRQANATYYAAQQDYRYMSQRVADQDMESTWVNECTAATQLMNGLKPAGC